MTECICPVMACPCLHKASQSALESLKQISESDSLEPEHRIKAAQAIINFALASTDIMHERSSCGCQHCQEAMK